MKYTFEQEPLTCVSLENKLGLTRGDIAGLTIYPDGKVEVETAIELTASAQDEMKDILAKHLLDYVKTKPAEGKHKIVNIYAESTGKITADWDNVPA